MQLSTSYMRPYPSTHARQVRPDDVTCGGQKEARNTERYAFLTIDTYLSASDVHLILHTLGVVHNTTARGLPAAMLIERSIRYNLSVVLH